MSAPAFRVGDHVALSAKFLRSMGTMSLTPRGSGWSKFDKGIGVIIGFAPDWPELAYVRWDAEPSIARAVNVAALVARADLHREAQAVEMQPLKVFSGDHGT